LTERTQAHGKTTDQKTTKPLQAAYNKGSSELLPCYPQPPPQQSWTSQKRDKTTICSGFMSRFQSL
jgi:hypothetical protein